MESELFARMDKMLASICTKFSAEGIPYDDLRAEANYSFLKAVRTYRSDRCKISTWIWKRVHYDLLNFIRSEKQRRMRFCTKFDATVESCLISQEERGACRFDRFVHHLPADSQAVVELLIETPAEIEQALRPPHRWMKVYRKVLRKHFETKHCWSKHRIDRAFRGIEKAL